MRHRLSFFVHNRSDHSFGLRVRSRVDPTRVHGVVGTPTLAMPDLQAWPAVAVCGDAVSLVTRCICVKRAAFLGRLEKIGDVVSRLRLRAIVLSQGAAVDDTVAFRDG